MYIFLNIYGNMNSQLNFFWAVFAPMTVFQQEKEIVPLLTSMNHNCAKFQMFLNFRVAELFLLVFFNEWSRYNFISGDLYEINLTE